MIAAMQGHGIGAGWTLGMFADFVLLSEESQYVSPYMNYGFTPGAGATWILAEKMGQDLARESLLTAQPYGGSELKSEGLRLPVLPRAEVDPAAMALAKQIAQAYRGRLIASQTAVDRVCAPAAGRDVSARTGDARKDVRRPIRTRWRRFRTSSIREIEATSVDAQQH